MAEDSPCLSECRWLAGSESSVHSGEFGEHDPVTMRACGGLLLVFLGDVRVSVPTDRDQDGERQGNGPPTETLKQDRAEVQASSHYAGHSTTALQAAAHPSQPDARRACVGYVEP